MQGHWPCPKYHNVLQQCSITYSLCGCLETSVSKWRLVGQRFKFLWLWHVPNFEGYGVHVGPSFVGYNCAFDSDSKSKLCKAEIIWFRSKLETYGLEHVHIDPEQSSSRLATCQGQSSFYLGPRTPFRIQRLWMCLAFPSAKKPLHCGAKYLQSTRLFLCWVGLTEWTIENMSIVHCAKINLHLLCTHGLQVWHARIIIGVLFSNNYMHVQGVIACTCRGDVHIATNWLGWHHCQAT
jgi:hypothetical protein